MKNSIKKRGFTIVELIIVIAVIAILAAVLIPTFSSLINKSLVAADESLVRNLNEALAMDVTNPHKTMSQALEATKANGFDVSKINARASTDGEKHEILWDSLNDCFVYRKGDDINYIPKSNVNGNADGVQLWHIANDGTLSDKYSNYLAAGTYAAKLDIKTGLDVGEVSGITTINYSNPTNNKQNVTIVTNSASTSLNINGYVAADGTGDTIVHYGYAGGINVIKCATASYHEYGTVAYITATQGRVVAESGAIVKLAVVNDGNAYLQENGGSIEQKYATSAEVKTGSATTAKNNNKTALELTVLEDQAQLEKVKNDAIESVKAIENKETSVRIASGDVVEYTSLEAFRDSVNKGNSFAGYTITLQSDVDLENKEWTPIGIEGKPFAGIFDGNGKTIYNLKVTATAKKAGLFGNVIGNKNEKAPTRANAVWSDKKLNSGAYAETNYNAIVKNFTVSGLNVSATDCFVGGAVGYAENAYIANITIDNGTIHADGGKVGGVVGATGYNMVLTDLKTEGNVFVSGNAHSIAGIVGSVQRQDSYEHLAVIYNCVNNASVEWKEKGSSSEGKPIAGIVAHAGSNKNLEVVVANCTNNGLVKASVECSYASGIIGQASKVKVVIDCTNNGEISANAPKPNENYGVSGIVIADKGVEIVNCQNTGKLTNTAENGKVYAVQGSIDWTKIENQTFDSVSALQKAVSDQAAPKCETIVLKNVTVSNTTGELEVPAQIKYISSDTKVCESVKLTANISRIDMVGLTQTFTGDKLVAFGGSGNTITVEANATVGDIAIGGNNNKLVNNGTMGSVTIKSDAEKVTVENAQNATMKAFIMIETKTTADVTLTNKGTITRNEDGGHTVWVQGDGKLTLENYGSIIDGSDADRPTYALLFYGSCTVNMTAYQGSTVTGGFAPYSTTHQVTIRYYEGATVDGADWSTKSNDMYKVFVSKVA